MTVYSYTLSSLRTALRDLLNEASADFFTDAVLNSYINSAVRDIAIKARCIQGISSASTETHERYVDFTGYKCVAVEYEKVSLIEIAPLQAAHIVESGKVYPQYFFEWGLQIGIEPIPPGAYPLTLYIVNFPVAMIDDDETPDIPYAFCNLIVPHALSLALSQDNKEDVAMAIMNLYEGEVAYLSRFINAIVPDGDDNLRME